MPNLRNLPFKSEREEIEAKLRRIAKILTYGDSLTNKDTVPIMEKIEELQERLERI